jgi:hypothetical protein
VTSGAEDVIRLPLRPSPPDGHRRLRILETCPRGHGAPKHAPHRRGARTSVPVPPPRPVLRPRTAVRPGAVGNLTPGNPLMSWWASKRPSTMGEVPWTGTHRLDDRAPPQRRAGPEPGHIGRRIAALRAPPTSLRRHRCIATPRAIPVRRWPTTWRSEGRSGAAGASRRHGGRSVRGRRRPPPLAAHHPARPSKRGRSRSCPGLRDKRSPPAPPQRNAKPRASHNPPPAAWRGRGKGGPQAHHEATRSALAATKAAGILLGGGGCGRTTAAYDSGHRDTACPGAGMVPGTRRAGAATPAGGRHPPAPAAGARRSRPAARRTIPAVRRESAAKPSPAISSQHRPVSTTIHTTAPLTFPQVNRAHSLLESDDARSRTNA